MDIPSTRAVRVLLVEDYKRSYTPYAWPDLPYEARGQVVGYYGQGLQESRAVWW